MIKLSIIVPVYGVELYLRKCVDSLLTQDIPLSEYEIILVDDGSPDACPKICDEYVAAHKNIRVIHRENGGLSAARNSGIEIAQGVYVMFVDSDDYIEPDVLAGLLKQVERDKLDVLRFKYQNVRLKDEGFEIKDKREYEVFEPFKAARRDMDYSDEVTDGETFLNQRLGPACYVTQFVIRRNLIYHEKMSRDKSLYNPLVLNDVCLFRRGIYFEDTEWTPRMLLRAKRVASSETVVYNYLWREGSITLPDNSKKQEKILRDKITLLQGFNEQRKLVEDATWYEWMTSFTAMTYLELIADMDYKKRKEMIMKLWSLNIFPLSTKKEKGIHKFKIMLANINPTLYCNLRHIMRK